MPHAAQTVACAPHPQVSGRLKASGLEAAAVWNPDFIFPLVLSTQALREHSCWPCRPPPGTALFRL